MKKKYLFTLSLILLSVLSGCSLTTDKMGSLSISSKPGQADIYVNGKLKGNTPKKKGDNFILSLPEGSYKVEIIKPFKRGSDEYYSSESVVVKGNNQKLISAQLKLRKTSKFREELIKTTGTQVHQPDMVKIPAGVFTMGCVSGIECKRNEKPPHNVETNGFMLSQNELTFEQWDTCVALNGCSHYPEDNGFGRGKRPVFNVSWDDAQEYISWINQQTGKKYRLPSESEWEYAARAGTSTPYYTGACLSTDMANYDGDLPLKGCKKGIDRKQTLEVGSFPPNSWGLNDMYGNVWEWTQDCWVESYHDAPSDGSARIFENCPRRVLRGGGWDYKGDHNRSAIRYDYSNSLRLRNLGFRLAM